MGDYLRSQMNRRLVSRQAKKDEAFAVPVRFVKEIVVNKWDLIADEFGIEVLSDDEYSKKYLGDKSD